MRLLAQPLNTVWKFGIPCEDNFTLTMPAGSIPLSVGVQAGIPVLWAAVDSRAEELEQHRFFLLGTGHPLLELQVHLFVGTFHLEDLGLVFHLFDGGPMPSEETTAEAPTLPLPDEDATD